MIAVVQSIELLDVISWNITITWYLVSTVYLVSTTFYLLHLLLKSMLYIFMYLLDK